MKKVAIIVLVLLALCLLGALIVAFYFGLLVWTPRGTNQASIDGDTGTPPRGIPVRCGESVGNVHIPANSFSGTETIMIECVSDEAAQELDALVKASTGETNEVLGAITLEPSPFDFDKDVALQIPLLAQQEEDLWNTYQDLYVHAPNENDGLLYVDQALIASDGWSATANVEHFSTFVLAEIFIDPVPIGAMVEVPAGEFLMGTDSEDNFAQPMHTVYLDTFYIDAYEVTNGQYEECVNAGGCTPPSQSGSETRDIYYGEQEYADYPVIHVSWDQAVQYCTWAGKRLPTEAEWEKAARGTNGRAYPWGEAAYCSKANISYEGDLFSYNSGETEGCEASDTTSVGSYPAGISPYGAYDMTGNVDEWVNDWFDSTYYQNSPYSNPTGPDSGRDRVVRGGSWRDGELLGRTYERDWDLTLKTSLGPVSIFPQDIGIRCASDSAP